MSILRGRNNTPCGLAFLAAAMLITATANAAAFDPADVRTTTRFEPPMTFGVAADGRIFPGDPLIGLEIVEVRVFWDIVVADGHNAADINAYASLPIDTDSGFPPIIALDGPALGWFGDGPFELLQVTDRLNGFFPEAPAGFGWTATGLPFDAVEILPTSHIEIDYIVPEPSTMALLILGAMAVCRKRRRAQVK